MSARCVSIIVVLISLLTITVFLSSLLALSYGPDPDTRVRLGNYKQEMDAATARARSEVENFLTAFRARDGSDFSIMVAVTENGRAEHFWLTDIRYKDGVFEGFIGSEPGIVKKVKYGQPWKVQRDSISDWTFMRGKKAHGCYTLRPLLKAMDPAQAEQWKARFAEP